VAVERYRMWEVVLFSDVFLGESEIGTVQWLFSVVFHL